MGENNNNISQKPNGSDYHVREYFTLWLKNLEKFINERDRRYEEQFESQERLTTSGLAAIEKQHIQAIITAEKSIEKALEAQREYNQTHNNLLQRMDAQYKEMVTCSTHDADIKNIVELHNTDIRNVTAMVEIKRLALEEKIDDVKKDVKILQDYRAERIGREGRSTSDQGKSQWTMMLILAIFTLVVNVALRFLIK